jgi:predicted nucleic acid-binding protein
LTAIVVDASVAGAWFLPDEHNDATDRLMVGLRSKPGFVPSLFWFETRNLFLMAERRGRLKAGDAALSMTQLRSLPLQDQGTAGDHVVLALATRHALSGYDASYLALSVQLALPLATTDRKLADAGRAENIIIIGPLAGL